MIFGGSRHESVYWQLSRIMGMSENVFKLVCDLIGIQFLESWYVQKFAKNLLRVNKIEPDHAPLKS